MTRFIFVCNIFVVIFAAAAAALAAGNYQRTKDDKTIVWNDDPKPGDAAEWLGDRDKENYATGMGKLIWYKGDGSLYARYQGKMLHGKLDGAVNVRSKGKTGHATFAAGKRINRWSPGPASSRAEANRRLTAQPSKENAEPASAAAGAQRTMAKMSATEQRTAPAQAQEDKARPAKQIVVKKESAKNPITQKQDIPAEGPPAGKKAEDRGHKSEGSDQGPLPGTGAQNGAETTATSSVGEKKNTHPLNAGAERTAEPKLEVDDFMGPPPALREDPIVETPSTAEPQAATSPRTERQLTAEEAANLADTEASVHGYDLSQYQRTNADYSKVKREWSLSYDLKQAGSANEKAPHFRVSVDDATRKAEVKQ